MPKASKNAAIAEAELRTSRGAELDLDPDAWPKFEAMIKSAAKMGHKPHVTKSAKKRKRAKVG